MEITMSYTKPDQSPFAANLASYETVVKLDNGRHVAVRCESIVEPNSGNPAVTVRARVVNDDGTSAVDGDGKTIESSFSHCSCAAEIDSLGGVAILQKLAIMAVLGEPTDPLWQDPIHTTMLQNASIRTNIASAAHSGPVNTESLL